jgi:hypothetical protein
VAAIPLTTPQGVGEQLIGLLHGQEALLVTHRAIGMEAFGQASVGRPDLVGISATQDAQRAVRVVGRPAHRGSWSSCRL